METTNTHNAPANNMPAAQLSSNNELAVTITGTDEATAKKMQAWAVIGKSVTEMNQSLSLKAQQIIGRIKLPTGINDVVEVEKLHGELKKELEGVIDSRKSLTSKFDTVASALMAHEKSIKEALEPILPACLQIKKAEAERVQKEQAEIKRKNLLRESYINFLNQTYVNWKNETNDKCLKAYEWALNEGKTPEEIPGIVEALKGRVSVDAFKVQMPENADADLWAEAVSKVDMPSPADMLAYYHKQLTDQFNFYSAAFNNKQAAIEQAKQKAEADKLANEELLTEKAIEAKLEAVSTTQEAVLINDIGGKSIKRKFEVDWTDESLSYALKVSAAFIANSSHLKGGIRVKSYNKLTIEQMGAALAWYKNNTDSNFECGVLFKEVEKL